MSTASVCPVFAICSGAAKKGVKMRDAMGESTGISREVPKSASLTLEEIEIEIDR